MKCALILSILHSFVRRVNRVRRSMTMRLSSYQTVRKGGVVRLPWQFKPSQSHVVVKAHFLDSAEDRLKIIRWQSYCCVSC
jgi:hypothetical protein